MLQMKSVISLYSGRVAFCTARPAGKTPITHQPINHLKKQDQIWIWDTKNCQSKVKQLNNCPTISSFSEHASDEVCEFTIFWQGCILHRPTSLGKTPIAGQAIDRSTKRDQIWIDNNQADNLRQNSLFQVNFGTNESSFSGGACFVHSPLYRCTK